MVRSSTLSVSRTRLTTLDAAALCLFLSKALPPSASAAAFSAASNATSRPSLLVRLSTVNCKPPLDRRSCSALIASSSAFCTGPPTCPPRKPSLPNIPFFKAVALSVSSSFDSIARGYRLATRSIRGATLLGSTPGLLLLPPTHLSRLWTKVSRSCSSSILSRRVISRHAPWPFSSSVN